MFKLFLNMFIKDYFMLTAILFFYFLIITIVIFPCYSLQPVQQRRVFHVGRSESRLIRYTAFLQQHLSNAIRDTLVSRKGKQVIFSFFRFVVKEVRVSIYCLIFPTLQSLRHLISWYYIRMIIIMYILLNTLLQFTSLIWVFPWNYVMSSIQRIRLFLSLAYMVSHNYCFFVQ